MLDTHDSIAEIISLSLEACILTDAQRKWAISPNSHSDLLNDGFEFIFFTFSLVLNLRKVNSGTKLQLLAQLVKSNYFVEIVGQPLQFFSPSFELILERELFRNSSPDTYERESEQCKKNWVFLHLVFFSGNRAKEGKERKIEFWVQQLTMKTK